MGSARRSARCISNAFLQMLHPPDGGVVVDKVRVAGGTHENILALSCQHIAGYFMKSMSVELSKQW